ncbi:MAG: Rpn family recombination-promoting nuclease/putative transposase [Planctomycetes bacterium]|nr:Rpn family recombination-promoting nuclease/putative transposase [Planctomycetota bacterium]
MTNQPHDALFKASLTPEAARSLCRAVLPPEVAQAFEGAEITRAPGEFVEEALRDRSSDVLYRAVLGEQETLIYVLFEHQSTVDRLMAFGCPSLTDGVCKGLRRARAPSGANWS